MLAPDPTSESLAERMQSTGQRRAGIDEAGYGPILGPLAIAQAVATIHDSVRWAAELAACGVDDSKVLHDARDLSRLERVALGAIRWLTGSQPRTAAELFTLMGEPPSARASTPWMAGADALALPAAASAIPAFAISAAEPEGLSGALIHPQALNDAAANGRNRAQVEWDAIGALMAASARTGSITITCDRLGGRKFYSDPLASIFPWCPLTVITEVPAVSRYAIHSDTGLVDVTFVVGGERADPLVALASCVAKYAREVHLLLFNGWWSQRCPGLRPTAGYGIDAHRWLADIGPADRLHHAARLIRGAF